MQQIGKTRTDGQEIAAAVERMHRTAFKTSCTTTLTKERLAGNGGVLQVKDIATSTGGKATTQDVAGIVGRLVRQAGSSFSCAGLLLKAEVEAKIPFDVPEPTHSTVGNRSPDNASNHLVGDNTFNPSIEVNLDPNARFVDAEVLRAAYLRREGAPDNASPFVVIKKAVLDKITGGTVELDLELGIVDVGCDAMANAVSSLLSRSLEDAKYGNGGYLPPTIVGRVQRELISPFGVRHRWGEKGYRFVLSRDIGHGCREIVGTVLVSKDDDTIFFFTSKFNNVTASNLRETVDFDYAPDGTPEHKWFDKFDLPPIDRYKPKGFHHLANFVIEKEGVRRLGLSRTMIETIVENYTDFGKAPPTHAQPMLPGIGFWQIGDPPWLERMGRLGFFPRLGAESFHMDCDWDPLIPTLDAQGEARDHVSYNRDFGIQDIYSRLLEGQESAYSTQYNNSVAASALGAVATGDPLLDRIPHVLHMANSGKAKIQYFQLLFPFEEQRRIRESRELDRRAVEELQPIRIPAELLEAMAKDR